MVVVGRGPLSEILGDKGLFRSTNILQIVDVVRVHAVLAMFIDNISSSNEKNVPLTVQPFCSHYENN